MEFPAPDDLDGLLPEEPLTPVQTQLLHVAREVLAPAGIAIRSFEALPLGLRLHLGYASPATSAETGRLVLYHDQRGCWTRTGVAGEKTALAQAAARLLVATGLAPTVPLW